VVSDGILGHLPAWTRVWASVCIHIFSVVCRGSDVHLVPTWSPLGCFPPPPPTLTPIFQVDTLWEVCIGVVGIVHSAHSEQCPHPSFVGILYMAFTGHGFAGGHTITELLLPLYWQLHPILYTAPSQPPRFTWYTLEVGGERGVMV